MFKEAGVEVEYYDGGIEEKCMSADSEIEEKCISVPFDMIKNTPEDNDLGWLVRKMYTGR